MFLNQQKIDKEYSSVENLWGKSQPNKYLLKIVEKLPKNTSALDLGCGEGRNSLYLAKLGFDVTAVDISEIAIDKLKKSALEQNLKINTSICDISTFDFDKKWDLVISTVALHLLNKNAQETVINKMKKSTKESGINLITIFNKDDPGYIEFPNLSFRNLDELIEMYEDWEKIISENYTKFETHNTPHTHHISVLATKKK